MIVEDSELVELGCTCTPEAVPHVDDADAMFVGVFAKSGNNNLWRVPGSNNHRNTICIELLLFHI